MNYLKVWLGVFIVAAMALIGWLAAHIDNNFKSYLAIVSVAAISAAIGFVAALLYSGLVQAGVTKQRTEQIANRGSGIGNKPSVFQLCDKS